MQAALLIHKIILYGYLWFANAHPYHVSASEMEYDASAKRIEISTKIFTDDFEDILNRLYKQKVDLQNEGLKPQMTELIRKYITTHLSIQNGGRQLPLSLYGWEIDHEAVYVYTIANTPSFDPKSIIVENTVLYDLFTDQVNIVHFILSGKRKSSKLVYPDRKLSIYF